MELARNPLTDNFAKMKEEEFRSSSTPNKHLKFSERIQLNENTLIQLPNNNNKKLSIENSEINYSVLEENLLNQDILREINSPCLSKINKRRHSFSSFSESNTENKSILKNKKSGIEKFKKKKADLGLQGLEIKIKDLNKKNKNKNETNSSCKVIISPIFHGDEDSSSSKINHSFPSEIHLKNNKNYIPKDKLLKNFPTSNVYDNKDNQSFSYFVEANLNKVISNEPSPIIIVNHRDDDNIVSPKNFIYGVHNSLFQGNDKLQGESESPVEKIIIGETYFDQYCINNNLINKNKISSLIMNNSSKKQDSNQISLDRVPSESKHIDNKIEINYKENNNSSQFYYNNNQPIQLSSNYYNNSFNNPNSSKVNYSIPINNQINCMNNNYLHMNKINDNNIINHNILYNFNPNYHQNYQGGINTLSGIPFDQNNVQYNNNNTYYEAQQTQFSVYNSMKNNMNTYNISNYSNTNNQEIFSRGDSLKNRQMNIDFSEMGNLELSNHCLILAKDQPGCRFLQKKLEEIPNLGNEFIFPKIKYRIVELMNDQFGNYFIQKVFEFLKPESIYEILEIVYPYFYSLCINSHGTRVIQRLLDFVKTIPQKEKISEMIKPRVIDLVKDLNGNHIIQKYISLFSENDFIFEIIIKDFFQIVTDKHGCCVLQKCIEVAKPKFKTTIVNMVVDRSKFYISDQYANYVLQYIISLNDYEVNRKITESFLPNLGFLGKHKFSSNVIEKVFDYSDDITKEMIIRSLNDPIIIQTLLFDMYGNYVIQKALAFAKEPYYSNFIRTIFPVIENLKNVQFGPKLYNKLLNTYPEFSNLINQKRRMINGQMNNPYCNFMDSKSVNNIQIINPIDNRILYTPNNVIYPPVNNFNVPNISLGFRMNSNLDNQWKYF